MQIGLFSAGGSLSSEYAPMLPMPAAWSLITPLFCYKEDIPLVVPEVNPAAIADYRNHNIITVLTAQPFKCSLRLSRFMMLLAQSINVATYQVVSGTAKMLLKNWLPDCRIIEWSTSRRKSLSQEIAFNVLPHIDVFQENGYTKEEMKMVWNTKDFC